MTGCVSGDGGDFCRNPEGLTLTGPWNEGIFAACFFVGVGGDLFGLQIECFERKRDCNKTKILNGM